MKDTKSSRFIEKLAKYRVVVCEDGKLFKYAKTTGRVGFTKLVDEGEKLRAINEEAIEQELYNIPLTFSERAKIILLDVLDLLNLKKFRFATQYVYAIQPLHAKLGVYIGDYVYADIKDCYFNIYKRFLRVSYQRGAYLGINKDVPNLDKLDISKRVKRSMFGIMRSNSVMLYTAQGGKLTYSMRKVIHNLYNPDLANFTYDLLHAIARFAVEECQAVYFNTDGCIIPRKNYEKYREFLNSLGLDVKTKGEGNAEVRGVGAYAIGERKTVTFERVRSKHDFTNLLEKNYTDWLLERLRLVV